MKWDSLAKEKLQGKDLGLLSTINNCYAEEQRIILGHELLGWLGRNHIQVKEEKHAFMYSLQQSPRVKVNSKLPSLLFLRYK